MSTAVAEQEVSFSRRLREITRGLIVETNSPDPHEIARAVLERLSPRQHKEALAVCLADWVRVEMTKASSLGREVIGSKRPTTADRVRSWYANQLSKPMFCGGDWKFLRDCSADDLHLAAEERYRAAQATHAEGDRWTKVALFMEEHDRETVAQVSEQELKQLLEAS